MDFFYFPGIGTVVIFFVIFFGGICGLVGGKFLTEKIRQTLQISCALAVIFIGIY